MITDIKEAQRLVRIAKQWLEGDCGGAEDLLRTFIGNSLLNLQMIKGQAVKCKPNQFVVYWPDVETYLTSSGGTTEFEDAKMFPTRQEAEKEAKESGPEFLIVEVKGDFNV